MKARTGIDFNAHNRKTIKDEVLKEYKRIEAEQAHDISVQTTADIFYALELLYGFKASRLKKILSTVTSNTKLGEGGVFGRKFDVEDIIKHFADMGIDLDSEIQTEIIHK